MADGEAGPAEAGPAEETIRPNRFALSKSTSAAKPRKLSDDAFDVLSFGEGEYADGDATSALETLPPGVLRRANSESAADLGEMTGSMDLTRTTFAAPVLEEMPVDHSDITHSTHSAHLDLTKWGKWVTAVAIVGFDLELGQSLEKIYPSSIVLDREDIKNVCFMSFPDSMAGCSGDTEFHFRVRASTAHLPRYTKTHRKRYLCGAVYFRQIPDKSLRRGFFQKSVVILSEQPHPTLYRQICRVVAKDYFSGSGGVAVQAACMDISRWPPPNPGTAHKLRLLGRELSVQVPDVANSIMCTADMVAGGVPRGVMLASPFDPVLFEALQPVLTNIQLLWELMVTSEPVVVSAPTPTLSSRMVLALTGLTAPLPYRGDFRPYFTVQDTDCKTYVKQAGRFPCAILGVTNPYFETALEKWPTKLWLAPETKGSQRNSGRPRMPDSASLRAVHNISPVRARSNGALLNTGRWVLRSACKQVLEHDRVFMKKLLSTGRPAEASRLIRLHFWGLTQQFLIPLESFAARLMPLKKAINPFTKVPNLGPFKPEDFIEWMRKDMPPSLASRKGNWLRLYSRFLNSPNFRGWLADKQAAANAELVRQYLSRVVESDLMKWASKRSEIEVLDLYLQITDVLVSRTPHTRLIEFCNPNSRLGCVTDIEESP